MSDQGSPASVVHHEAGLCDANVALAFDFRGPRGFAIGDAVWG